MNAITRLFNLPVKIPFEKLPDFLEYLEYYSGRDQLIIGSPRMVRPEKSAEDEAAPKTDAKSENAKTEKESSKSKPKDPPEDEPTKKSAPNDAAAAEAAAKAAAEAEAAAVAKAAETEAAAAKAAEYAAAAAEGLKKRFEEDRARSRYPNPPRTPSDTRTRISNAESYKRTSLVLKFLQSYQQKDPKTGQTVFIVCGHQEVQAFLRSEGYQDECMSSVITFLRHHKRIKRLKKGRYIAVDNNPALTASEMNRNEPPAGNPHAA